MPVTLTAKLRCRYSSVTDAPPIRSMIAAVWKTVSMPSTAFATVSASQMSPSTTSSRGWVGERRRGSVEGADVVPAVQQFGHQVGADEAGASGDEHTAEFGGQR